jgi:hypothetical protein
MRLGRNLLGMTLITLLGSAGSCSKTANSKHPSASTNPFLGRWDLTLKTPDREYPSWLEITEEDGHLKVRMVGRWGHARLLPKAEIANGQITFVSPKEEEGRKDSDMAFVGKLSGKFLRGTTSGPDGAVWTWRGERVPLLNRTGVPHWGEPIKLFNGKDLTGWKVSDPGAPTSWKVEAGTLVSPGRGPDLLTTADFEDFKLHIEFNCAPKSNSGVYLRGRYELQIEDDPEPEGPSQRTGGIYGFLAPYPEAKGKPGEWQTYDVVLVGRMVTVALNGRTIIDNQEIPGITGGALDSHEGLPAPIYLQGSEDGHVMYRNIVITPAWVSR